MFQAPIVVSVRSSAVKTISVVIYVDWLNQIASVVTKSITLIGDNGRDISFAKLSCERLHRSARYTVNNNIKVSWQAAFTGSHWAINHGRE